MVHVKYDKSLSTRGNYNSKRKEISILPSLKGAEKVYVLSHEFLHHVIHIYIAPQLNILDKIHDYIAFGYKYFSSFQTYRKARKHEVYFQVCLVERDKLRRKFRYDGKGFYATEKEAGKVLRKIREINLLEKEAIRLLKARIKKLKAKGKKVS